MKSILVIFFTSLVCWVLMHSVLEVLEMRPFYNAVISALFTSFGVAAVSYKFSSWIDRRASAALKLATGTMKLTQGIIETLSERSTELEEAIQRHKDECSDPDKIQSDADRKLWSVLKKESPSGET